MSKACMDCKHSGFVRDTNKLDSKELVCNAKPKTFHKCETKNKVRHYLDCVIDYLREQDLKDIKDR